MKLIILTLICASAINAESLLNENLPPKPVISEDKPNVQLNPNTKPQSIPDSGDKSPSPLSVENEKPSPIKFEESLEFLKSLKSSQGSPREARQAVFLQPDLGQLKPQVNDDSEPEERSLLLFTLTGLGLAKKTWLLLRLKKRFKFPFLLFKSAAGDGIDPQLIANPQNIMQLNPSELKDIIDEKQILNNLKPESENKPVTVIIPEAAVNPEVVISLEPVTKLETEKEIIQKEKIELEKLTSDKLSGRKFHAHKLKIPSRFLHGEDEEE